MDLFMVELRVRDAPAAWAWFRDVLGLQLRLLDPAHRFALLDAGGTGLAVKQGVTGPPGEAVSLVFRVDDLDAERTRLAALDLALGEIVENPNEAYREFRLTGPEGLSVRLFAWTSP